MKTIPWVRPEIRHAYNSAREHINERHSAAQLCVDDDVNALTTFAHHYDRLCGLPRRARRAMQNSWKASLAAIALLLALGQGSAFAATINVHANTPPVISADGKCSLAEAIINANSNAATHSDCAAGDGADTLVLPAGSRHITSASYGPNHDRGLPLIESPMVIQGNGSVIVGSDGDSFTTAVLEVATSGKLTLNTITVTGGEWGGGGVLNRGALVLNRSSITGCAYYDALTNEGGTIKLNDSSVSDNHHNGIVNRNGAVTLVNSAVNGNAQEYGDNAGITNGVNSTLFLRNSTVQNNGGRSYYGGGIVNAGTLTVSHSRVSYNHSFGPGGGIQNNRGAVATVSHSTIAGNRSSGGNYGIAFGGGIANFGTLTVATSTLSGNWVDSHTAWGYGSYGGAIFNDGVLTVTNSTVTGNRALHGGGIGVGVGGQVTLSRTIVSGNTVEAGAGTGPEVHNVGTILANDFNLVGHNGNAGSVGFTSGAQDIVASQSLEKIFLPLASNGGKTQTHALAINSPALNASPADAGCAAKDQRGVARPQGTRCDIGAFEGSAVMCSGVVTTQVGTPGRDVITGTPGPDVIAGLGGNDIIRGLGGDDIICGGSGADTLYGGKGLDTLVGDSGNDVLFGEENDDVLNGGAGTDRCNGGANDANGDYATQCEYVNNVP